MTLQGWDCGTWASLPGKSLGKVLVHWGPFFTYFEVFQKGMFFLTSLPIYFQTQTSCLLENRKEVTHLEGSAQCQDCITGPAGGPWPPCLQPLEGTICLGAGFLQRFLHSYWFKLSGLGFQWAFCFSESAPLSCQWCDKTELSPHQPPALWRIGQL